MILFINMKVQLKKAKSKAFDMNAIKLFYLKGGLLFRHVSVFSWFDLVCLKRFTTRGVLTEKNKVMTVPVLPAS